MTKTTVMFERVVQQSIEDNNVESSFNSLKTISSLAIASFSLIAIPFVTISAEATEEKSKLDSQLSAKQTHLVSTEIEMTDEDATYIYNMREHYHLD